MAEFIVSRGEVSSGIILNSLDSMTVLYSGTANSTTVNSGGRLEVNGGGTANRTTVNSGGSMYIHNDCTANRTTVNSGGWLKVSSGGTATEIVENGGYINVIDGADVTFVSNTFSGLVLSNAAATVHSGTTANSTTVNPLGYFHVSSGGVANSTTVNSGGQLHVSSGGTANRTTVYNGGLYVSSGGTANDTRVSGGGLQVLSGGTATNIYWTPCEGRVHVSDGGYVTFVSQYSGVYFGANNQLLSHTAVMGGKTIGSFCAMYIMNGGTANDTRVSGEIWNTSGAFPRGSLYVSSGGTANRTIIYYNGIVVVYNSGVVNRTTVNHFYGYLYVSSGGVANNTTVNSGGQLHVSSGGVANSTTVNSGSLGVGGTANSTTVNSGGWLDVFSGGTATNIDWTPCEGHVVVSDGGYATFVSQYSGVYFGSGNKLLSNTAVMDGKTLDSAYEMCVMNVGVANSTTVNSSGSLYVYSEGTANYITVNALGGLYVSSGGTANNTTVNSGGWLKVSSGGTANSATVSAGNMFVSSGGIAKYAHVNIYGQLHVSSGGVANNTTVNSGGWLKVSSGGTAINTTHGGSRMYVSGGTAINTTVNSPTELLSYALADYTTVNSRGVFEIHDSSTANHTTVHSGGTMYVAFDAFANDITVLGGVLSTTVDAVVSRVVISGGNFYVDSSIINDVTVYDGGGFHVRYKGIADSTTVNSGGGFYVYSSGRGGNTTVNSGGVLRVLSGGKVNAVVENGGYVYIANSATASFASNTFSGLVLSNGLSATVHSGTTANSTTIDDGAVLNLYARGKLTGQTTIKSGAVVSAFSGANLNFDISRLAPGAAARINNLSLISGWGNAIFTLTVSGSQANGMYTLADGASEFNQTITVQNTSGSSLGTLTLGNTMSINGTDYLLTLDNGALALTIGNAASADTVAPTVSSVKANITTPTNGSVTVTATFSDNVGVTQTLYRIGTTGQWQNYANGVTVNENATVYFKAVDAAGNESEVASCTVANIDKIPPVKPTASASITTPTNGSVTVTATFSDNVGVTQTLYRIGTTGQWQNYVNGVTVNENATVYFKAVDAAGNESEVASYTVANIKVISGAVVSSGYSRIVSSGFIYVDPIISSGGLMIVSSGGSVRRTTLTPGAHMAVSSGGRASEIMENGGSVNVEDNASATFVPNTISGLVLSVYTGRASVHSGTTATSATIRAGGGLGVYSGGTANNTMIYSGGTLYLYGGTVNSTTQYYGGFMVFSASEVYDTVLNSGWIYLYDGSLNRTNVNGGFFSAYKGTTLSDTTISGGYGYCCGTMDGITTICSGGSLYIASNGILTGQVNIASGGSIFLSSGASVYLNLSGLTPGATARITHLSQISGLERASFTISLSDLQTDGTYVIAEGASGFNRTISVWTPYGNCSVSAGYTTFLIDSYYTLSLSGGTLSLTCSKGTIVRSGRRVVSSGWTSDGISVLSAGGFYVFSDGTANDTEVNSGGYMYVLSDGTANDTEVDSGGSMYVSSGGTANFTTVSSGGVLSVISGGTANFTTVSPGGVMIVYTGGVCRLNEQSRIKNYAKVSAFRGAVFDFDISETDSVTTACIENLSRITGVLYANYVITVSNSQSDGTYTLADGATGFNKTISVVNTSGEELGSLSIGETTTIGGTDYTLNLNDGTLSVTLSGSTQPESEPELPADTHFFPGCFAGGTQAMLAKRTDRIVTVYQNGEPWGLGVTLDPGWEVVGIGDFSGDGLDDFLRVNGDGYVVGEMSNGNGTFSPQVLNFLNDGWSILGVGDFNGNGTDDVLIANPTGASDTVGLLGYWESGVTWTLINGYSPEWECVATGDYNGDGKCDMLWRNQFEGDGGLTYNAYCTWIVEDPVDWRMVSVANPAEWNFLCSGDFNGDKTNDIAMINGDGVVGIWGVNDGYLSSWFILSAVTSEWQLAGVGDFNGDGTDDIAWANTDTGLVGYWQIENKELASWANIVTLG